MFDASNRTCCGAKAAPLSSLFYTRSLERLLQVAELTFSVRRHERVQSAPPLCAVGPTSGDPPANSRHCQVPPCPPACGPAGRRCPLPQPVANRSLHHRGCGRCGSRAPLRSAEPDFPGQQERDREKDRDVQPREQRSSPSCHEVSSPSRRQRAVTEPPPALKPCCPVIRACTGRPDDARAAPR